MHKLKPALTLFTCAIFSALSLSAQSSIQDLYKLSNAKSRSISPENFSGAKGKGGMATTGTGAYNARELGQTWKISPSVIIKAKSKITIAEIDSSGCINHIWMTPTGNWRFTIIRIYWDDESTPSVECPVGDFFCMGWGQYSPLNSLAVCVNPGSAFNCYWPMPFRKKCKITMENIDEKDMILYYSIDYELKNIAPDAAYFHAQYRRVNPNPNKKDYVLLDSVEGKGQYVGTYIAIGVHNNGWWGEREMKFFMDGDKDFPTICGTGTEDYFGGSYDFDTKKKTETGTVETNYTEFNTPYSGLIQVLKPDGHYNSQTRFGLYRWHITDPIRFEKNLKVTIQDLGWHNDNSGRYLPLQDDISSTVFWYQLEPHGKFPKLPSKDELEVN